MFVTCSSCNQKIYRQDDRLNCKNCSSAFHLKCTSVSMDNFMDMARNGAKQDWKCFKCLDVGSCLPLNNAFNDTAGDGNLTPKEGTTTDQLPAKEHVNKYAAGEDVAEVRGAERVSDPSVEVFYLKEIIRQKDIIINNQNDLIISLKEQISYLKSRLSFCEYAPSIGGTNNHGGEKLNANVPSENTNNYSEVLAKSITGSQEPIDVTLPNLSTEDATSKSVQKEKGRHSRKPIVGKKIAREGDGRDLRAAKMMRSYTVTKLDPLTTQEDVEETLQRVISQFKIEKLNARYPESYSSFKITVSQDDEAAILDPELWPLGSKIYRFFHSRKKLER